MWSKNEKKKFAEIKKTEKACYCKGTTNKRK